MLLKIHPETPQKNYIKDIAKIIKDGGIIIFPTDSVYGLGCDIYNTAAAEKVAKLKGMKLKKADFSFLFDDISMVSNYTKPLPNSTFKLLKKNTPGPFTFILEANSEIPQIFRKSKKTLGVRIPDNLIIQELIKEVGNPILTTSIKDENDIVEYTSDPTLIYEKYEHHVDAVIDGGYGNNVASAVVDCTDGKAELIREGVEPLKE